jgi:hypothetical protein
VPPAADEVAPTRACTPPRAGDLDGTQRLLAGGRRERTRPPRPHAAARGHLRAPARGDPRCWPQAGADLGLLENDRYDAVTIAAVADDEETLRLLLQLGASAKLTTSRYDGTALIAAAHLGHDGVVRQLIAAGAPLDHVNNLHWTALIESIVLGDGGPRHQATLQGAARRQGQPAARRPQRPHAAGAGARPQLCGDGSDAGEGRRTVVARRRRARPVAAPAWRRHQPVYADPTGRAGGRRSAAR